MSQRLGYYLRKIPMPDKSQKQFAAQAIRFQPKIAQTVRKDEMKNE